MAVHVRIKNLDGGTHPCVFHHSGGDSLCRSGLEIQVRVGVEPAPAVDALTPGKLSAAVPYFLGRLLDPLADRLFSHRRPE